jgi:hypothetical protein
VRIIISSFFDMAFATNFQSAIPLTSEFTGMVLV